MNKPIDWLLSGAPWVQHRTRLDLLGESSRTAKVKAAREAMLDHPQVQALLAELSGWPGPPLTRHNDASHLLHKLTFIADLGLRANDPGVDRIVERILAHTSAEGMFQVLVNIPIRFGGAGQDQFTWMLCDAPSIIYALAKLGVKDRRVTIAAKHLARLIRDNGWPCAASPEVGKFRGRAARPIRARMPHSSRSKRWHSCMTGMMAKYVAAARKRCCSCGRIGKSSALTCLRWARTLPSSKRR